MTNVSQRIEALRSRSETGPIGQQTSRDDLYKLLGDCAVLARDCDRNPEDRQALVELIQPVRNTGRSRAGQVNSTSTNSQLVCRLVFSRSASPRLNTANASRYGKALEEAARRGIDPIHVGGWLKQNGGVNALFLARPLEAREVRTKSLLLTEAQTIPKHGVVTLALKRTEDGRYDVVTGAAVDKHLAQKAIDALHAAYGLLADASLPPEVGDQLPAVERQIVAAIHDLRASLLVGRGGLVAFPGGKRAASDGSGDREVAQA
jgi:hypothetical protein